jgi:DNA-binding transcriptional LysR family regulator
MAISNYNSIFRQVDLSLLKHFFDVATYGGFTKASHATGASQPALSLGLQKLERDLGVSLARRGGGKFSLTEEGRELLQFCNRFESGLQSVVESFGAEPSQARALRIGTALSVGFGPLLSLCAHSASSERPMSLELETRNTYELLRAVSDSQLDAALIPDDIYDSGLNYTPLYEDYLTLITGPQFAHFLSKSGWMQKLATMSLITFPRETPMRSTVDKLLRDKRLRFERVISVNSMEALKMLVSRNMGAAFVQRSLVAEELRSKSVFEPKQRMIKVKSGVALATRKDERGTEIVKLILDLMKS